MIIPESDQSHSQFTFTYIGISNTSGFSDLDRVLGFRSHPDCSVCVAWAVHRFGSVSRRGLHLRVRRNVARTGGTLAERIDQTWSECMNRHPDVTRTAHRSAWIGASGQAPGLVGGR